MLRPSVVCCSVCLSLALAACDRDGVPAARSIKPGATASGSLTDQDPPSRGTRGPFQVWMLRGDRGQRLIIDLTSSAFDPFLSVRDDAGFLLAQDDDSGDELGARVRVILPRKGVYRLVVTSIRSTARGEFRLTVGEWITPDAPDPGATRTLTIGEPGDGMLEPGDELAGDGPFQDRWTLQLAENQRARVEMRSTDFDSYLMLLGPDGRQVTSNDDGLGNRDAVMVFRAAQAGSHTVLATTYGEQPRMGAYRVTAAELTGAFAEAGAALPLANGETKDGMLEPGDSAVGDGRFVDFWDFTAPRAGAAIFDMTSTAVDAHLTLLDDMGNTLATDDDSGGERNARLTYQVTAGARYRLRAGTFGTGSGPYRIAAHLSQ